MGNRLVATVEIKLRSQLISDTLVLDKPILTRRSDRLLVQAHGIKVPAFDASNLGCDQCRAISEILGAVLGPETDLCDAWRVAREI